MKHLDARECDGCALIVVLMLPVQSFSFKPLRGTPNSTEVKDVSNQVVFIVLGQRFYCSSESKFSLRTEISKNWYNSTD